MRIIFITSVFGISNDGDDEKMMMQGRSQQES